MNFYNFLLVEHITHKIFKHWKFSRNLPIQINFDHYLFGLVKFCIILNRDINRIRIVKGQKRFDVR